MRQRGIAVEYIRGPVMVGCYEFMTVILQGASFFEADQWASGVRCQEIKHIYLSTLAAAWILDNCMFEGEV